LTLAADLSDVILECDRSYASDDPDIAISQRPTSAFTNQHVIIQCLLFRLANSSYVVSRSVIEDTFILLNGLEKEADLCEASNRVSQGL